MRLINADELTEDDLDEDDPEVVDWTDVQDIIDFYVYAIEEGRYKDLNKVKSEVLNKTKDKKITKEVIETLSDIFSWRKAIDISQMIDN